MLSSFVIDRSHYFHNRASFATTLACLLRKGLCSTGYCTFFVEARIGNIEYNSSSPVSMSKCHASLSQVAQIDIEMACYALVRVHARLIFCPLVVPEVSQNASTALSLPCEYVNNPIGNVDKEKIGMKLATSIWSRIIAIKRPMLQNSSS